MQPPASVLTQSGMLQPPQIVSSYQTTVLCMVHPVPKCHHSAFVWGRTGSIFFFCFSSFFHRAEKGTPSLTHARRACLPLSYIQALFSRSYLLVVGLRCPCGSDMLMGLRMPGLHQWFSNITPCHNHPWKVLSQLKFCSTPSEFLT